MEWANRKYICCWLWLL